MKMLHATTTHMCPIEKNDNRALRSPALQHHLPLHPAHHCSHPITHPSPRTVAQNKYKSCPTTPTAQPLPHGATQNHNSALFRPPLPLPLSPYSLSLHAPILSSLSLSHTHTHTIGHDETDMRVDKQRQAVRARGALQGAPMGPNGCPYMCGAWASGWGGWARPPGPADLWPLLVFLVSRLVTGWAESPCS
jgi:hypothetical protein